MRRISKRLFHAGLVGFGLIQLVPYGRDHDAPVVIHEPEWDSPRTRELAKRACFDCHSNQTRWPWYGWIAPVSWLLQRDVDEGRAHLNFSEFDKRQRHAEDTADELRSGEMPPWFYLPLHAEARLSEIETEELARGFERTFSDD